MNTPLTVWTTVAINLPEHGNNPVHTDAGAIAAGFAGALVAGTTIHAYLTHPAAAVWGASWLDGGWSELRLIAPVMDRDLVVVGPSAENSSESPAEVNVNHGADDPVTIEAKVDGPWVHVRSAITHLGPVAANASVEPRSALVDRFDSRAGERVVLDIEASVGGQPVARIEHESIVRLR